MACGLDSTHGIKFYPWLAKRTTVNAAIMAQQIYYWQCREGGGRIHEGVRWVYNTYQQWAEQTGLTVSQVKDSIKLLEDAGVLLSAQLDKANYNHVKSYRIDTEHEILSHPGEDPAGRLDSISVTTPLDHRHSSDQPSPQPRSLKTKTTSNITTENIFNDGSDDTVADQPIAEPKPAKPPKKEPDPIPPELLALAERMELDVAAMVQRGADVGVGWRRRPEQVARSMQISGISAARIEFAWMWALQDPYWGTQLTNQVAFCKQPNRWVTLVVQWQGRTKGHRPDAKSIPGAGKYDGIL